MPTASVLAYREKIAVEAFCDLLTHLVYLVHNRVIVHGLLPINIADYTAHSREPAGDLDVLRDQIDRLTLCRGVEFPHWRLATNNWQLHDSNMRVFH